MVDFDMAVSDMPERITLDTGYYLLVLKDIKQGTPKAEEEEKYKLHYVARFEVQEPEEEKGTSHFERFWIGSDTDRFAESVITRRKSRGLNNLRKLITAAGLPTSLSFSQALAALLEQRVVAKVRVSTSDKGTFVNIDEYYNPMSSQAILIGTKTADGPIRTTAPIPVMATNGFAATPGAVDINCPQCNESVPRSEYGKHAVSHSQPQVAN